MSHIGKQESVAPIWCTFNARFTDHPDNRLEYTQANPNAKVLGHEHASQVSGLRTTSWVPRREGGSETACSTPTQNQEVQLRQEPGAPAFIEW